MKEQSDGDIFTASLLYLRILHIQNHRTGRGSDISSVKVSDIK